MSWLLMLLSPASAPAHDVALRDFDLRKVERPPSARRRCGSGAPDEIVVCASPDSRVMEPLGNPYEQELPRAEFGLGGRVQGRIYTESVEFAPGMISKRIMFGIKLPF